MTAASLEPGDAPQMALRRTRSLASGVLGLMALIFVATHFLPDTGLTRLIQSMAEAGMIGGLADWFAVEALFRRPLGLPIPHTALLPRNQERAARNVGQFFQTHFLEPASLQARLIALRPGSYALEWLSAPENAALISHEVTRIMRQLLEQDPSPRALARSRRWLRAQAESDAHDPAIAAALARLVKEGMRSTALGEVLVLLQRAIDQNRDIAADLVQTQSRWWIASAVDRRLANAVVAGVLSLLDELQRQDSELRRDLEQAFSAMVDQLATDGTLTRAVGEGREVLIRSGALNAAALRLGGALRDRLRTRLAEDPDAFAAPVAGMIRDLASRSAADPAIRAALDARTAELAAKVIGDLRPAIADYVGDVIASWEPEELNARFEAEIGSDLQYIRINGAVLGALIGGALFALNAILT